MVNQETISAEEFKRMFGEKNPKVVRGNKYGAKRTEYTSPLVGTRTYDSKAEAKRAAELDMLWKAGEIAWWLPQVPIPLPGGIKYFVDFQYYENPSMTVVWEDCKGMITKVSALKIKQVEEIYGIEIEIVK